MDDPIEVFRWTGSRPYGAIYGMSTVTQVISHAAIGHHSLFEPGLLRFAMSRAPDKIVSARLKSQATELVSALSAMSNMAARRDRIAAAPLEVQELLVRLYFETLYRHLESGRPTIH